MRHGRLAQVLLVVVTALACGGGPTATFSAGDLTAVQEALALRGATVLNAVSGDPGCQGSDLHSNALRLELQLAGEDRPHDVYLFRWRRPAQFDAAAASFADCVTRFRGDTLTEVPETLEVPPWRAFGRDWTPELRRDLEDALRAVGGG